MTRPSRLREVWARGTGRRGLGARRRGSAILLVIAILSLLVLLAITLSFTSRLEIASADNFARGVQNRNATLTLVEPVGFSLARSLPPGPTSPLDFTLDREFLRRRPGAVGDSAAVRILFSGDALHGGAALRALDDAGVSLGRPRFDHVQHVGGGEAIATDAAALVDINTAGEELLARLIDRVAKDDGRSANGRAIAKAIVATRLGPDGAAGRKGFDDDGDAPDALEFESSARSLDRLGARDFVKQRADLGWQPDPGAEAVLEGLLSGIDEGDEAHGDPRRMPFGDDVIFRDPADLLRHEAIRGAGLTSELLAALSPHITVFSAAQDEILVGLEARPALDINRATPEEIVAALSEIYRDAPRPEALLRQFAVNLADARDVDSTPTVYPGTEGEKAIIGVERTPRITEVYPNSVTPDAEGDEGEFIELLNPWNEDLDVGGWTLEGPGVRVALTGRIPAKGYLIVTDDADNRKDDDETHVKGTGSLYDIFGVLGNGSSRRVVENITLNLPSDPNRAVTITLSDASGNSTDQFTYRIGREESEGLYSFQRENPVVPESRRLRATPFAVPPRTETPEDEALTRLADYPLDAPFLSPVDALEVFAGFNGEGVASRWSFPVLASPHSQDAGERAAAEDPLLLDARVIDIFAVETTVARRSVADIELRRTVADLSEARQRSRRDGAAEHARALRAASTDEVAALVGGALDPQRPGSRRGAVNINTAGEAVLASVPGLDEAVAGRLVDRRNQSLRDALKGDLTDALAVRAYSDLLIDHDLWRNAESPSDRRHRVRALLPHIALNSRSFAILGRPSPSLGLDAEGLRALETLTLVAVDRDVPEFIWTGKPVVTDGGS